MIIYLILNIIIAIALTFIMFSFAKVPIYIKGRKKLITRIEKEFSSNYNNFKELKKSKFDKHIEFIVISSGLKIKLSLVYLISFAFSILGGFIGCYLKFPFLILVLTIVMFFIPIFVLFLIGSYQNGKSYKTTFKVLHTAEKASQLTNSPLIIFRKILPFLCIRDRKQFQYFLDNFDANKEYTPLFNDLEKNISNSFIKELIIYGRETSKGINYNGAINLILRGYNKTFELMEERKRNINGMVYLLYALSLFFIGFSIYITSNYMMELQSTLVVQIFFKTTIIAVILSVILASIALINANKY